SRADSPAAPPPPPAAFALSPPLPLLSSTPPVSPPRSASTAAQPALSRGLMWSTCCSVTKSRPSGQFDQGTPRREADQDQQGLKEQGEHDNARQEDEQELQRLEQERREQEAQENEERELERRREDERAKERQEAEEAEQERQKLAEEAHRANKEKEERTAKVVEWMKTHGFSEDISEINMHKTFGGCCSATSMAPLHLAAQKGDHEMVELMVKTGARVDELDGKRRTAEQVAQRCNKKGSHDATLQSLKDTRPSGRVLGRGCGGAGSNPAAFEDEQMHADRDRGSAPCQM
ncbi:unnamed protein product, partial [Prorocentrum cordatum]